MRKAIPIFLLLALGVPTPAAPPKHRHVVSHCPCDRDKFDIVDGRLREDIYRNSFGPLNVFYGDVEWRGPFGTPGSKFLVNRFWFKVTDFEWPDIFTEGQFYYIVWVDGRGYSLCSPNYPGVHVSISVL